MKVLFILNFRAISNSSINLTLFLKYISPNFLKIPQSLKISKCVKFGFAHCTLPVVKTSIRARCRVIRYWAIRSR